MSIRFKSTLAGEFRIGFEAALDNVDALVFLFFTDPQAHDRLDDAPDDQAGDECPGDERGDELTNGPKDGKQSEEVLVCTWDELQEEHSIDGEVTSESDTKSSEESTETDTPTTLEESFDAMTNAPEVD